MLRTYLYVPSDSRPLVPHPFESRCRGLITYSLSMDHGVSLREICMDSNEFKRLGGYAVPLKIASTVMSHFSRSHSGM